MRIKCFVSHRPTDPFFSKSKKKKTRFTSQRSKYFDLQAPDLVVTTIAVWCDVLVLNLHRYYVFKGCLDINLLPSDYISYRLNVRFNIICKSKLEKKVFIPFFLPDRPTHHHKRRGEGKRNILLAWPYEKAIKQRLLHLFTR